MLAPVTHILPLTFIRRSRTLPVPGQLEVRPGQKVNASDVVAVAHIPSGHMSLDIRRSLGIPRASAAERCIIRQQGDRLEKGDIIAEAEGVFSRIVRAPVNGEVVSISGGKVLLRVRTTEIDVRAGFNGMVSELVSDFGAVIETSGSLVQGVWGNGRIDSGLLFWVTQSPDDEFTRQQIDVSMRGAVVLGGHCSDPEALRAAAELPLRGLILASMTAGLIPLASSLNFPILVVDGFGRLPLNACAFDLLKNSEKRDVSINAAFDQASGERPELVIPLPAEGQVAKDTDYFAPGQLVRIQGMPYTGKVGTIVQLRKGSFTLPNGLKVQAADVNIDGDTRITVPLANLEVIE